MAAHARTEVYSSDMAAHTRTDGAKLFSSALPECSLPLQGAANKQ